MNKPVRIRVPLAAVVAAEACAIAAAVTLAAAGHSWWPAALIAVVVLALGVVQVHRHSAAGWIALAAQHLRAARRTPPVVGAAVDVPHGGAVYGVRCDGAEAVSMVAVAGRAYTPTLLRGAGLSLGTNTLELDLLVPLLDQPGGVHVSIDIVNDGSRVRHSDGYPPLYSTLLADRPAAARRTFLVVRLPIEDSVAGLEYRESVGLALAAATERIVNTLKQSGIRAEPLTAAELDERLADWTAGVAIAPRRPADASDDGDDGEMLPNGRPGTGAFGGPARPPGVSARQAAAERTEVRWRSVRTKRGYLTTYYLDPDEISTSAVNRVWALRSDAVVQTVSLSRRRLVEGNRLGEVMVSVAVRTCEPQQPQQTPSLNLATLTGEQGRALLVPAPMCRRTPNIPGRPLSSVSGGLSVAIGYTGVLVGTALRDQPWMTPPLRSDDLVMWSLTDPVRATRVRMDTSDRFVRQMIIRSAAFGERIAIYTERPRVWEALEQSNVAVVGPRRPAAPFVPTIIINDNLAVAPAPGLSATVVTLGPWSQDDDVDLTFVQFDGDSVRITPAGDADGAIDVGIVAFRQEQVWLGLTG